ncbi:MAG: beta-ketoacyl synthase N-terminal-like domain-containing protein, partial [Scytonema sp. PMC 1069.18]|nr:beta-ketoacyl synthase N-terminal-like domain-containing protein [Scytonema sp. PMC 1069.18]
IGMGCKVPGANNIEEYWNLLANGKSAISEVPGDRWSSEDYFEENGKSAHTTYSKRGGFIESPYDFDTMFFGISPKEAGAMDPQQRVFLEVAWQALQQAGYGGRYRTQEVGVFVGCGQNNYAEHFLNYQQYAVLQQRLQESPGFSTLSPEARQNILGTLAKVLKPSEILPETAAGNELNGIAARVSHCLNLTGPSLAVGTACSSSLVALHLACESLRSGQSRMAIAGGVNLNLSSTPFTFLSKVQALSPSGSCYPFDSRANGMVLGEGAGVVVLKTLDEAIADGDYIYAVVKGSAVNNDGHSQGITAPNPKGQAEAIRKAYANARINPETVSYIETHGTGTLLGDPVEVEGMTQAFRSFTDRQGFCAIGSVKSSIGHMLSASGIVSLIKVVLAMQHGKIPGTVGFEQPNPHIKFADTPFYVAGGQGVDWSGNGDLLRAGVNGFGFGGTNCHVILEQAPELPIQKEDDNHLAPHLLFLTARTQPALKEVAKQLHEHLLAHPEYAASQICLTMNNAQKDQSYKAALFVNNRMHMLDALSRLVSGEMSQDVFIGKANPQRATPIHLVLDGNTTLTTSEVEILRQRFSDFQAAYTECESHWGRQLTGRAYTFAVQYALGRLLMSLSVQPSSLLTEETGILVGACLCGMLSLEQAMSLLTQIEEQKSLVDLPMSPVSIPTWNCPLVTPQGTFRHFAQVPGSQLAAIVRSFQRLNASHCQDIISEAGVYLHLGGTPSMRAQLEVVDNPQVWMSLDKALPIVNSLLVVLGKLYTAGVRLNSLPLFAQGLRRVPVPTYPFERQTYKAAIANHTENKDSHGSGLIKAVQLPALSEEQRQSTHMALLSEFAK